MNKISNAVSEAAIMEQNDNFNFNAWLLDYIDHRMK